MLSKTLLLVGVYLCRATSSLLEPPLLLPLSSFCLNITEKLLGPLTESCGEPLGSDLQEAAAAALNKEELERCMLLRGSTKSTIAKETY